MNFRTSAAPQAVKMALPKEFSGKREELNWFIMSCLAHLVINWEVYDADEKKIEFMMALLNEGEAGVWKGQFIQVSYDATTSTGTLTTFRTFDTFLHSLKAMFQPHNDPADALAQLRALQFNLGENINEHITKFKMALAWTKLDKSDDSQATIVIFKETVLPWLIQQILGAKKMLKTLSGWYKKAAFQEQNWREINAGNLGGRENCLLWRCTGPGFLLWRAVSMSTPSPSCIQSVFAEMINKILFLFPWKSNLKTKLLKPLVS